MIIYGCSTLHLVGQDIWLQCVILTLLSINTMETSKWQKILSKFSNYVQKLLTLTKF